MESGDGAVIADPDVGSVGAVTEGFGGEGDGSRDVWQKWREFAVQVVIFYIYLDFREKKKKYYKRDSGLRDWAYLTDWFSDWGARRYSRNNEKSSENE